MDHYNNIIAGVTENVLIGDTTLVVLHRGFSEYGFLTGASLDQDGTANGHLHNHEDEVFIM